jgi:GNAT superfamily N-acetyltransferase
VVRRVSPARGGAVGAGGASVVEVRVATDADVPALASLRRAWTEEVRGTAIDDDGFEDAFAAWWEQESAQRVTWVAAGDSGPGVVGMLNLAVFTRMPRPRDGAPWAERWGYLANVYVVPAHRGRGTGRLLLEAAVAHADREGFARLVLSPSERSVPFYTRAGFGPATSLMVRTTPPGTPTGAG